MPDVVPLVADAARTYLDRLGPARSGKTPEATRRLRVAVRKLRALLELNPLTEAGPTKALKHTGHRLGELRDWQVLAARVEALVQDDPTLAPARRAVRIPLRAAGVAWLAWRQDKAHRHLLKALTKLAGSGADVSTWQLTEALLDQALLLVAAARTVAADDCHANWHQVRLAGKKLRYLIELAGPRLPGLEPLLMALLGLQSTLGRLQDIDRGIVLLEELAQEDEVAAEALRRVAARMALELPEVLAGAEVPLRAVMKALAETLGAPR